MRPLLNYYGGKWNAAEWIISYFPDHKIYVEVFGGGASVLLKKNRSEREILNDLDDELFNLYLVLREEPEALLRKLKFTPHSRSEYLLARHPIKNNPIEQARRTIIKSYFGIGDSIFHKKSGMRSSKTSHTCVAKSWRNWIDSADQLVKRLSYDSKDTFFYMDPPYVQATRSKKHSYTFEFTDKHHHELLGRIQSLKGKAIISGYESEIYRTLDWKRVEKDFRTQKKTFKAESLWLCNRTAKAEKQLQLIK